jgi:hypothetical protein
VALDPTILSGKRLWLRAKDNTGANGSAVTSWADKSGLANNATATGTTPTVATATTPNGGRSVAFGGAGYYTFANFMSGATAGEAWVVIKSTATQAAHWAFGADGFSNESHYPYNGVIYESFGQANNGLRSTWTTPYPLNVFRLYRVRETAAGGYTLWLDDQSMVDGTAKTVAWCSTPQLGAGRNSSGVDLKLTGNIAEIIIFDRVTTSTEVGWLIDYFNTEHGLTVPGGVPWAPAASNIFDSAGTELFAYQWTGSSQSQVTFHT